MRARRKQAERDWHVRIGRHVFQARARTAGHAMAHVRRFLAARALERDEQPPHIPRDWWRINGVSVSPARPARAQTA